MEVLKSVLQPLQPITQNLPAPIRDLGVSIIGDVCYKTLILDLDPTDAECLKLGISKGLGIGIIGASSIVKVPQILKLMQSKSADGISFLSYLLETSSYLISLAYNVRNGFPFSTFGETALILGQNVIITVLVLNYSGRAGVAAAFVATLAAAAFALFTDQLLDMKTLGYLQAGAGVLGVGSKIPQIAAIWQEGGTGQLSAFTVSGISPPPGGVSSLVLSLTETFCISSFALVEVSSGIPILPRESGISGFTRHRANITCEQIFNYLAGSLSRIFTTLQEVDDKLILYGFIAGFALNLVLASQMIYYWNAPSAKVRGKMKEAPVAAPASSGTSSATTPKSKGPTTRRRG